MRAGRAGESCCCLASTAHEWLVGSVSECFAWSGLLVTRQDHRRRRMWAVFIISAGHASRSVQQGAR